MATFYLVVLLCALGLYITAFVYRSTQAHLRRKRLAAKWGCRPVSRRPSAFFGIGTFLSLMKATKEQRLTKWYKNQHDQYGTTFEHTILGRRQIHTIEPENIKTVLALNFSDYSLNHRYKSFYPFLGDGIFTQDGISWSHSRAILRPQFSREQIADVALLSEHVDHLIAAIPKDKSAFDIQDLFYRLTLDTATEFLFGESTHCLAPDHSWKAGPLAKRHSEQEFAKAFARAQDLILTRFRAQSFYWLINPPEFRRALKVIHDTVDYYVDRVLNKGPATSDHSSSDGKRYIILEEVAKDTKDRKALRDQMLNILLAGRDTTASLLSSSFFFLARHPRVWKRLRQDINQVLPPERKGTITLEQLREIKYLRYFINEVLRLLPPVSLNGRLAVEDTVLPLGGGPDGRSPVLVQKGQIVAYEPWVMHRRTDVWGPDAIEFRPERWEENSKRGWEYLPFNGGPRICLGQQYALTEVSYVIVRLLQQFDTLENADPKTVEPNIRTNLTVLHMHGIRIRLYSSS